MNKQALLFLLALSSLVGCTAQQPEHSLATTKEASFRASLEQSLGEDLNEVLAAAKATRDPSEAEKKAREAFERKKHAGFTTQFQVQAQRLSDGRLQLQVQAQLSGKGLDAQAQRQLIH